MSKNISKSSVGFLKSVDNPKPRFSSLGRSYIKIYHPTAPGCPCLVKDLAKVKLNKIKLERM